MALNEYHMFLFNKSTVMDGKGNTKNNTQGCLQLIRLASYRWILRCMANHTMYPTMKENAATAFPHMFALIMFWCQGEKEYSKHAEMIFDKLTSTKSVIRFTSSEFVHHGNRVSLHFSPENSTLRVTPWVPFLLCLAQSMYENVDGKSIVTDHLFKGGYFNGKAPGPKGVKKDGKTKAPSETLKNMFIYSKSIEKCPNSGVRLAFDNQIEQPLTTRRTTPYGDIGFPNNAIFLASMLFDPASKNTKFPSSFDREQTKLMNALSNSKMPIKDLLPITPPEAEVDDDGDDDDDDEKPQPKPKIKHELVEQCLIHIAQKYCELENAIDEYQQYATTSGVGSGSPNDNNDNTNPDDDIDMWCSDNENPHVNNTLTALQNYHDELKDVLAESQNAFKEFADLLGLKNAGSSRSFLLTRKCSEIQAVDGKASASLIRGYLELAAKTAQNPRIIYTNPLKLKDLDKIVKSLGVDWEESFRSFANRVQIDAEMIEKGICAIHFKNVGNSGVSSSDILDAMEDGDVNNMLNIYHAQLNWLTKGWTSNIEHLTTTGKTLDHIEYLIWIEKETLYPALLELVRDDNSDQE